MEYEKKKNISKIISLIYLFFSLLILSYIIFRTEYYNLSYWYYKKYLIIIFFLIVFSLVSFYFSLKFKVNLSLTVISVILPIYLMEGLLTFNKWNNRIGDKRSYTQVYKDLKKDNKFILPTIPPSAFVNFKLKDYFPVSLIPNYEVINCNENGEYIVNKNDRYGFNTNDKTWEEEEIDYILLGDSFTYGYCEKAENNISGNLKKIHNSKTNIINLGMPGNGPLISYVALKEYYPKNKNIKNILWFFYPNDMSDLNKEIHNEVLGKYLSDPFFKQNLKNDNNLQKQIYLDYVYKRYEVSKLSFLRLNNLKNFFSNIKNQKENFANEKNLTTLKKIIHMSSEIDIKAKFYFIYLPSYEVFFGKNYDPENKRKILKIVNELKIPIIDMEESFRKLENQKDLFSLHKNINHYSKKGYNLVANEIINQLNN